MTRDSENSLTVTDTGAQVKAEPAVETSARLRLAAVPDKPAAVPPMLGFNPQADAPTCSDCGSIMIRNGACYKCWNCGATSGCS